MRPNDAGLPVKRSFPYVRKIRAERLKHSPPRPRRELRFATNPVVLKLTKCGDTGLEYNDGTVVGKILASFFEKPGVLEVTYSHQYDVPVTVELERECVFFRHTESREMPSEILARNRIHVNKREVPDSVKLGGPAACAHTPADFKHGLNFLRGAYRLECLDTA